MSDRRGSTYAPVQNAEGIGHPGQESMDEQRSSSVNPHEMTEEPDDRRSGIRRSVDTQRSTGALRPQVSLLNRPPTRRQSTVLSETNVLRERKPNGTSTLPEANDEPKERSIPSDNSASHDPLQAAEKGRSGRLPLGQRLFGFWERQEKTIEKMPVLRTPSPDDDGPWLREGRAQSIWYSLFYDLAVVAVLSVFTDTHELSVPNAIPIFLSYFTIISWLWTSQCWYDIRYQAEDSFHRYVKFGQICVCVYIGAASGNWNLYTLKDPDKIPNISLEKAALHTSCQESFTTIATSFAVSRSLLLLQYVVAYYLGKRVGRGVRPIIVSLLSVSTSIVLAIVAACLPFNTDGEVIVKILLIYLSVSAEIIGIWIQTRKTWHTTANPVETEILAERYGAFTLIILGEGFVDLTRAFSKAISGLSHSSYSTYAQVFVAIVIIVFTFTFLFGRFKRDDFVHHSRIVIWESIHFPLHFCLLLLLAAMTNFIVVIAFENGIEVVSDQLFEQALNLFTNSGITHEARAGLEKSLARLPLQPSFEVAYQQIRESATSTHPDDDAVILLYQYFGEIVFQATLSYGIKPSSQVYQAYDALYALNSSVPWELAEPARNASLNATQEQSSGLVMDMIQGASNEAISGVLWLMPAAGAVLILIALRSMAWYHYRSLNHWIIHGPLLTFGIGLGLLGLLDIGSSEINIDHNIESDSYGDIVTGNAPFLQLFNNFLPLVIVMLGYLGAYYTNLGFLWWLEKKDGDVFENGEESYWIAD